MSFQFARAVKFGNLTSIYCIFYYFLFGFVYISCELCLHYSLFPIWIGISQYSHAAHVICPRVCFGVAKMVIIFSSSVFPFWENDCTRSLLDFLALWFVVSEKWVPSLVWSGEKGAHFLLSCVSFLGKWRCTFKFFLFKHLCLIFEAHTTQGSLESMASNVCLHAAKLRKNCSAHKRFEEKTNKAWMRLLCRTKLNTFKFIHTCLLNGKKYNHSRFADLFVACIGSRFYRIRK